MRASGLAGGLGVVLAVAACGNGDDAPATRMFQPLADTAAPTFTVQEVVSVGREVDGGPVFQRVSGVAVGPDSAVWVLDGPAGRVTVLDRDGQEIRSFGGQGDGPGEFTLASAMGFLADTLWIIDAFSRETTFFSMGGNVLKVVTDTVSVDPVAFRDPARPSAYLIDGTMVAAPSPRDAEVTARAPVLLVDRESRERDTLAVRAAWTTSIPLPTGSFGFNPLTDHALVSVDPRGRWAEVAERNGDTSSGEGELMIRVRRRIAGDSLAFDVRYIVEGDPVTPASRDSVIEAGVERLRANMEAISELRESIDDPRAVIESVVRLPDYHPPITALVAASDGTTWLGRHGLVDGERTWTVLGPGGQVQRHVRLLASMVVRDADGERVWAVATDGTGVQRIVGLDMARAGEG